MAYREAAVPKEDDAMKCADRMRGDLQQLIYETRNAGALMWGVTAAFAELVHYGGGSDEPMLRSAQLLKEFELEGREKAKRCRAKVESLLEAVRAEGFGPDAILWALVGAIISLMQGLGHSASEIEKVSKEMIGRINEVRRVQ